VDEKEQQKGKVGGWGRETMKGRLVYEEGAARREGRYRWGRLQQKGKVWWMRRLQQEGMVGGCMRKELQDGKVVRWGRNSRKERVVDEEGTARREGGWMRK
jgi:hypothetical protein